jgi:hypothetical protein
VNLIGSFNQDESELGLCCVEGFSISISIDTSKS